MACRWQPTAYKAEAVLRALLQSPLLVLLNACFCMAVSLRGEADTVALQTEALSLPTGAALSSEFIQVNAGGRAFRTASAPMSPAMQCVVSLTVQYMMIYLFLQIALTYNQFRPKDKTNLEKVFKNATSTVDFCPMLAILFIGVRMRAVQLGVTPQPWAQSWMFICTYSILGQTILALLGGWLQPDEKQAPAHAGKKKSGVLEGILSLVQTLLMIGLYAGFTFVIISTFMITANDGNASCPDCPSYTAPVPPALQCTINLTAQYFAVYLFLNIVKIYNRVTDAENTARNARIPREDVGTLRAEDILGEATKTLAFCPMMAVLFIGARMRAVQIDPHGAPQPWAQSAFFLATYAILVQTLMVFFTAYFSGAASGEKGGGGDVSIVAYLTTFIKYAGMAAMYFGACTVIYSILVIQTPQHLGGPAKTPPVSPAMLCVTNLTIQFFIFHLVYALLRSYNELTLPPGATNNAESILKAAEPTIALIPMLCILFIGVRLRALELDPVNGSPQKWAQVCMFICSYAVLVQTLCSLLVPFLDCVRAWWCDDDDEEGAVDIDENLNGEPKNKMWMLVAKILTTFKFLAMICVYAGLTAIIISVLVINAPAKR